MLYRRGRRRWCDNIVIVKSIADIPCAYEIILGLSVNCCSSPTRSYSLLSIYLGNWSNRAKFVWDCVSVWISTTWNCLWRCESLLRVTDLICSVRGWCSLNNWMWWILCGRPVSQSASVPLGWRIVANLSLYVGCCFRIISGRGLGGCRVSAT